MKLVFVNQSRSAGGSTGRHERFVEGDSATELLDAWQQSPPVPGGGWSGHTPHDFRYAIVRFYGADVAMPAMDEEILGAVIAAAPEVFRLEITSTDNVARQASRAVRRR